MAAAEGGSVPSECAGVLVARSPDPLCKQVIRSKGATSLGWSEFGLTTLRSTARRCKTTGTILAGQATCAQVAGRRDTIYGSEG